MLHLSPDYWPVPFVHLIRCWRRIVQAAVCHFLNMEQTFVKVKPRLIVRPFYINYLKNGYQPCQMYMNVCNPTHPRALQISDVAMVGRALVSPRAIQRFMWMASTLMNPLSSWHRKMPASIMSQTAYTFKCAMQATPRSQVNMIW